MSARAYLSLGSNLGDRQRWLGLARQRLADLERLHLVSCSSVVETEPVDVPDQPDFLNQVLGVDTPLGPAELVGACLAVEKELGRDREGSPARGPRTIDVDVLLYEGRSTDAPEVTIPHPRLARRPFFLALCREAGAPEEWLPAREPA